MPKIENYVNRPRSSALERGLKRTLAGLDEQERRTFVVGCIAEGDWPLGLSLASSCFRDRASFDVLLDLLLKCNDTRTFGAGLEVVLRRCGAGRTIGMLRHRIGAAPSRVEVACYLIGPKLLRFSQSPERDRLRFESFVRDLELVGTKEPGRITNPEGSVVFASIDDLLCGKRSAYGFVNAMAERVVFAYADFVEADGAYQIRVSRGSVPAIADCLGDPWEMGRPFSIYGTDNADPGKATRCRFELGKYFVSTVAAILTVRLPKAAALDLSGQLSYGLQSGGTTTALKVSIQVIRP